MNQWQSELRSIVTMLQGMRKEDVEDCFYQIGVASEKLVDLADELAGTAKQFLEQK
jgi:hypothetical protein